MKYEYMFLTQGLDVPWEDLTPAAHAQQLAEAGTRVMRRIQQVLETAQGGEWEAVSHDLLRLDDGLILSVLARRAASDQDDAFSSARS